MKTDSKPRYKTPAPTRGGARPGAGRPKGSTTKVTLEDLVGHIEHHVGRSFAEQVAISYASAISRADHAAYAMATACLTGLPAATSVAMFFWNALGLLLLSNGIVVLFSFGRQSLEFSQGFLEHCLACFSFGFSVDHRNF